MEIEKRILCIGDSNTWGYDPRPFLGSRYETGIPWTDRLSRDGWHVLNAGQNGRAIPRRREFSDLGALLHRSMPLDAAAVMLGTNDLLQGSSAPETAGRMKEFLSFLSAPLDGTALLLIAPPPFMLGAWVTDADLIRKSEDLAEEYRSLAEQLSILFADAGEWGVGLAFDGVHFTPEGHAAFARGLEKRLGELL